MTPPSDLPEVAAERRVGDGWRWRYGVGYAPAHVQVPGEVFSSMIPAAFKYASVATVQEAIDLLKLPDTKVLAGGHSLLPLMKLRLANPPVLVDINHIAGLDYIREDPQLQRLQVGALVRHVDMERSPLIRSSYPLLHDAAQGIGDPQVRNRGTLAGRSPMPTRPPTGQAALLAYDGEVVATGPNGERVIPVRSSTSIF